MVDTTRHGALELDRGDPLAGFRREFSIPASPDRERIYLAGNSLGLQPIAAREVVLTEFDKWASAGVRGHFEGDRPWAPFHEFLTEPMARLVGAMADEVVVMNSLTANLHFLMVSFYRPEGRRAKILIEDHAFPSDHFAVESQVRFHGHEPDKTIIRVQPRDGEESLRTEDLLEAIESHGPDLALVMLPGVQYYTGQVLPMRQLVEAAHRQGAIIGLDLAHAAGNVEVALHDWNVDFAVWCTYKYLNGGPGATGAAFVHERHITDETLPRFHGWWGHDKATRFEMTNDFVAIPTAEAWQVSNAPIFSMAPLVASLRVFDDAGGMSALRQKAILQADYFDALLAHRLHEKVESITPGKPEQRGCQLSLRVIAPGTDGREVFAALDQADVDCDWRYPDVIRVAPVPLYNTFVDIFDFVAILEGVLL